MKIGITELVDQYAAKNGVTKKDARKAIEDTFDLLRKNLEEGNEIQIRGHFNLSVGERAARDGVNPKTKEKIVIPASRTVKFKPSKDWKMAVNA